MVVRLNEAGVFSWDEWTRALGTAIAEQAGHPLADYYYGAWLVAFERILASKGLAGPDELAQLQAAWREAAANTPHGEPIELSDKDCV